MAASRAVSILGDMQAAAFVEQSVDGARHQGEQRARIVAEIADRHAHDPRCPVMSLSNRPVGYDPYEASRLRIDGGVR
jgi:hypothetical protein